MTQGSTTTESYTFDPVGNRLSSLGVSPYDVNVSNELTSTPSTTYSYDNNGNTTTEVASSATTTFAWDYENRLTSVTLPGSGGSVTFKYDPFGRRIYKSSSSATSVYAYDGDNLIEETNSSGTVVARYSQGLNIDEPLAMLRSSTTSYYQADGLGSITSLSNGAGALAQTYTFDSFGKQTASSGSLTNPFQYTARESDPETGLYYYRARYYDPSIGRLLSEDPLGFDGGSNFYSYTGNSPVNFDDPFGLYTLKPKRHPVPPPSPQLDTFLNCLEGCVGKLAGGAGLPIVVTSTTDEVHADKGHYLGTSVDIRPPTGIPANDVFCCGGQCGAARGLNESPANGGQTVPTTQGSNYHFSLLQLVKHPKYPSQIPPGCKPGSSCSQTK
ncbi:MAG TPA: RHS repeat-associated core domain-containing protein [Candidatus Acidoferrum sp.]|nr:RHS repeat-associated core domain-containing protein [Candidatus Acidoferrum sp.]